VVVGAAAQSKRHEGTRGAVVIGDSNEIREHVTVHAGTDGRTTTIGSNNLLMVACHIAHDCVIGDSVVVANAVQIAGHCIIESWVNFGGLSGLAQKVRVGESAFVAAGAMVERDVPPFVIVQGDRARVRALNRVGLERRGVPEESIRALERALRKFLRAEAPRAEALRDVPRDDPWVAQLLGALGP
jgi:UDP-N-acetylglucosamine acyltransferase